MVLTAQIALRRWLMSAIALAFLSVLMGGQIARAQAVGVPQSGAVGTSSVSASAGVVLDRVVAVVNGDVILESDVDEERRFGEVQPFRSAGDSTRAKIIERLVNRTLILQQAALEPEGQVSDKSLDDQIATLRKDIPGCKEQYRCDTDEGWAKYLGEHGFTVEEFRLRWLQRMQLLKFIQVRFSNGISISDDEIKTYYEKTMLPEYARRKATAPPLDAIKRRIEEVLLQQQVGALLEDWLKSMRAEGSVQIFTPSEVAR
jgi:peptidyl-prolyl cis-trans isomerase SurA